MICMLESFFSWWVLQTSTMAGGEDTSIAFRRLPDSVLSVVPANRIAQADPTAQKPMEAEVQF